MRLAALLPALGPADLRGDPEAEVHTAAYDSRHVEAGALFCCVAGEHADGHRFAPDALGAGATALLVEHWLPLDVPQVLVPETRPAMARAAAELAGHPSRDLAVVGVTGTNGKTTTTHLVAGIAAAAGRPAAVLGTLSGPRTTPEAPDLQAWLAARRDDGTEVVAMEVSSHALALHRVDATHFAVAVFTNLSRDHLDFHGSMEAYFEAKARLFTPELCAAAVVNLDDPHGRLLHDAATVPTVGYRLADVEDLAVGGASCTFRWRGHDVRLPLGGRFNVSNALAAAEAARLLGVPDDRVAVGLSQPVVVPGRFEAVDAGQPFTVLVDYAHTPDALTQVLRAAREVAAGHSVHVVFGCGGDRDRTKRPLMGEVAAQEADRVVLTADNSRSEPTEAIIGAVQDGYERATGRRADTLVVEPDRDAAIGVAIEGAAAGDVVVVAGKGHEGTQTIGDLVVAFDDREVSRRHLARLGWRSDS